MDNPAKSLPALIAACLLPAVATAQPAAKPPVDACALLAAQDVSAVTALDVAPGKRHDSGLTEKGAYSSTCLWVAPLADGEAPDPTQPVGGASFAILHVMTWPDAEGAKSYLEDFRTSAEAHVISRKPVDLKVGDEGLWWGSGVAARKNTVSFGISVHLTEGDRSAHRGMEEKLAQQIAAKL